MMVAGPNKARLFRALIVCLFVTGFIPGTLQADIYRYIDAHGVIHFTNVPTSSDQEYRVYLREGRPKKYRSYRSDAFDDIIQEAALHHELSYPLLKALIKVESDFNPRAVSKSGALGLTQIMPDNLKHLKVEDPFDPWQNIMGGARYLNQMLKQFDGKLHLALAAYNAGPSLVQQHKRVPRIKETEEYVQKVMRYYYAYKK